MKNNEKLKNFFFKLLCYHLDNNCNEKKKKFFNLIYSINICKKCDYSSKDTISFLDQNINAKIVVLVEPYSLHPQFLLEDTKKITELFQKILTSIHLNQRVAYITSMMKCDFTNKKITQKDSCKESLIKELDIIKPEYIIGFGKSVAEVFLGKEVKLNDHQYYSFLDHKLFFVSSPVEVYYHPESKKELWEFLKFFRDNYLKKESEVRIQESE